MIEIEIKDINQYIVISGSNLIKQKERKIDKGNIKTLLSVLDTDSNYYWVGWLYKQTKDIFVNFEEFIDFHTDNCFVKIFDENLGLYNKKYNTYQDTFNFEREHIFSSILAVAKKKYLARKWKSDILPNPDQMKESQMKKDLKVTGLEIIKRDSNKYTTDNMYEFVYRMVIALEDDEIIFSDKNIMINKLVKYHKGIFYKSPFTEIATRKGVNGYSKYVEDYSKMKFVSGAPMNTKAAACWSKLRDDYEIFNVEEFKDKMKIHYCYTKRNKYGLKIIGMEANNGHLYDELNLKKYFPLNYKTQWEKTFFSIISRVYEAIGFNFNISEDLQDLEDML